MKEPMYHIELDDNQHSAVIQSLNDSRNARIAEGKPTDMYGNVEDEQILDFDLSETSYELLSEEDLQIKFNLIQEEKNNEIIQQPFIY